MNRMIPLLLLVCLLVCTACGASKQIAPAATSAARTSGALTESATTANRTVAASSLQTATATTLLQPTTAGLTTAASTALSATAAHTTAPLTTLTLTTVLTGTTAPTTRRVYTTTPFTTKAKIRTTTTRPAETTAAPATTAAPEEEGTTRAKVHTCTVSINCSVVLENGSKLKAGKAAFVPTGGQILVPVTVTFTPGEDAYTVLRRACEENTCVDRCAYCAKDGIQMEASFTPGYNTYYVQGIHQIYEKDCGAKSGWLYRVNGVYPNVGSSSYTVRDGDRIDWIYTLEPITD